MSKLTGAIGIAGIVVIGLSGLLRVFDSVMIGHNFFTGRKVERVQYFTADNSYVISKRPIFWPIAGVTKEFSYYKGGLTEANITNYTLLGFFNEPKYISVYDNNRNLKVDEGDNIYIKGYSEGDYLLDARVEEIPGMLPRERARFERAKDIGEKLLKEGYEEGKRVGAL